MKILWVIDRVAGIIRSVYSLVVWLRPIGLMEMIPGGSVSVSNSHHCLARRFVRDCGRISFFSCLI